MDKRYIWGLLLFCGSLMAYSLVLSESTVKETLILVVDLNKQAIALYQKRPL